MKRAGEGKYVVFSLAGQEYAAEISTVREIREAERVAPIPESPDYVRGVMDLRGRVILLIDLRSRLRVGGSDPTGEEIVIIVDLTDQVAGLVVDRVVEVLSLDGDAWEEAPVVADGSTSRYVAGICNLDGRLIVLIDLPRLMTAEETRAFAELAQVSA